MSEEEDNESMVICDKHNVCTHTGCVHKIPHRHLRFRNRHGEELYCTDNVTCGPEVEQLYHNKNTVYTQRKCVDVREVQLQQQPQPNKFVRLNIEVWTREDETYHTLKIIDELLDDAVKTKKINIRGKTVIKTGE